VEELDYIVKILVQKLQKAKIKEKAVLRRLEDLKSAGPVRQKRVLERRLPGERIRKKKKILSL